MIRLFSKSNPTKESLVGKFVFVEGNNLYASYSSPVHVVSESDKSYFGRELERKMEDGVIVYLGIRNDGEDRTFRRGSVACICDTIDDVNVISDANTKAREIYLASIEEGKALFTDLDGTEASPPATPRAGGPKP